MKKNMFKVVALSLSLGACGGGDGTSEQTGAGDSFNEGDSGASDPILGAWATGVSEPNSTFFTFFSDGTYVHVNQPEFIDEETGLEWGIYNRNGTNGRISAQPRFDENRGTGLSGSDLNIFIEPSNAGLLLTYSDTQDSGSFTMFSTGSEGIEGSWRSSDTTTQLEMLNFSSEGIYIHASVDNDVNSVTSGAERGTYTLDTTTGEITITQTIYDRNGGAGLSAYPSPARLFAQTDGTTLTLSVDTDGDGVTDESFAYIK